MNQRKNQKDLNMHGILELLQKSEVFLNEASPLFLWFKKKNVSVRSNQAMDSKKSTEETLEKNKAFVLSCWGRVIQIDKTKNVRDGSVE